MAFAGSVRGTVIMILIANQVFAVELITVLKKAHSKQMMIAVMIQLPFVMGETAAV